MDENANPLLAALKWVGESVDKPGAAVRGLLGGDVGALANLIPFSDTMGITDPSQRTSGRQLLEKAGLISHAEPGSGIDMGDIAGFATDVATDPLNWLGGLGMLKTAGTRGAAAEANVAREAMLAKGAMPAEAAAATKVADAAGPIRTYHGTPHAYSGAPDAAAFDPEALFGPGYYTTSGPNLASEYADSMSSAANIKRAAAQRGLADNKAWLADLEDRTANFRDVYGGEHDTMKRLRQQIADAELSLSQSAAPTPNIRMQLLDSRKPWDMEGQIPVGDVLNAARSVTRDPVALAELAENIPDHLPFLPFRNPTVAGNEAWEIIHSAAGGATGDKLAAQQAIRKLGYDSITHLPGTGSAIAGAPAESERVWIALHPNQVYAPWIAPAAKRMPGYSPLVAAMIGDNTARPISRF